MSKGIKFRNRNNEYIYPCPYFPIGSIYISTSSTDPTTYFGGTWERIKGKYLLGVDESTSMQHNSVSQSIGSWTTNSHTLTVDEIPSHTHTLNKNVPYGIPYNYTSGAAVGNGGGTFYQESYSPFSIANTGGGQGHNHGTFIPPSFTVYIWRRVS